MKNLYTRLMAAAALTALFTAATPALAQNAPTGRPPLTSVADVLKSKVDDYPVVVTGSIIKKIADEKYEFRDETGTIQCRN